MRQQAAYTKDPSRFCYAIQVTNMDANPDVPDPDPDPDPDPNTGGGRSNNFTAAGEAEGADG